MKNDFSPSSKMIKNTVRTQIHEGSADKLTNSVFEQTIDIDVPILDSLMSALLLQSIQKV